MNVDLRQGDCLEILPTLGHVDTVVTDPPYVLDNAGGHSGHLGNGVEHKKTRDELGNMDSGFDVPMFWQQIRQICFPFQAFVFCANRQISELMHLGESANYITTLLAWNKYNAVPFSNGTWRQDAEFIIHYRERGAYFVGNAEQKRKIVRLPSETKQHGHPTEKPLELIMRYVEISCPVGGTVIDPFMGSGTTGVACMKLGRNFVGIERDPGYFAIAQRRIADAQAQLALPLFAPAPTPAPHRGPVAGAGTEREA